jgi:hypothetical protein
VFRKGDEKGIVSLNSANILSCLQEQSRRVKIKPEWLATVTLLHKAMLESTKNNFATSEVKQLRRFSQ